MSTLLNVDKLAGTSIVPIWCGSERGTAFFISENQLLTAYHVVVENKVDESAIYINVDGLDVECSCEDVAKDRDIALLTCKDYRDDEFYFHLLASDCRKGQSLSIIGYPEELGNGIDIFKFGVTNIRSISNPAYQFDIIVRRNDDLSLSSYAGMSGSPVINEFGSVIGVVTDELYNTLGYTSIYCVQNELKNKGLEIEENADFEDTSDYGLGKCWLQVNEAQEKAGSRFSHDLQVENEDIESEIIHFAGIGFEADIKDIINSFDEFAKSIRDIKKKQVLNKFKVVYFVSDGISQNLEQKLIKLKDCHVDKDSRKPFFTDEEKGKISKICSKVHRYFTLKDQEKEQALIIKGNAGCGKTFALCKIAGDLCKKTNVYLFFGTDFSGSEEPLDTITRNMEWEQETPFEELNGKMEKAGRYAIFIIDAINEGAGTYFWQDKLSILLNQIKKWQRIKFIFSIRKFTDNNDVLNETLNGLRSISIIGFADVKKAIESFFNYYNIGRSADDYLHIQAFHNPLFLRIFCETYNEIFNSRSETLNVIDIYKHYISKCNHIVSKDTDADPRMNFAERILNKLASYSLLHLQCGDIPRDKAKSYSYHLCPYRTWSNDLLNNMLKANLLMEYTTVDQKEWISFEYDSMGDYLKADILLHQKCDDYSKLKFLSNLYDLTQFKYNQTIDSVKIENFIRIFLSVWNPDIGVWHNKEIEHGKLTELFIESLAYRKMEDDKLESDRSVLQNLLEWNPKILKPEIFVSLLKNNNIAVLEEFHNKLFKLSMAERDLIWSTSANALYYKITDDLNSLQKNNMVAPKQLLVFECWLLSASYPSVRFPVIRYLVNQLEKLDETDVVLYLVDIFKTVDDFYILQGLFSAIYGYVVRKRIKDLSISKSIVDSFYTGNGSAPQDFVLRHWTLKILEWQWHLTGNVTYWKSAQPPYHTPVVNPYHDIPTGDISEDFFGTSYGADSLHRSLFVWDFYRYIIGGNRGLDKFEDQHNNPIHGYDTAKAIALLIKNKYNWDEKLGEYDNGVPYETGHDHKYERIGKKYQWLGLSEVYAYLLDTCHLVADEWAQNKKYRKVNYPWLVSNHLYFDPSLRADEEVDGIVKKLFEKYPTDSTLQQNRDEWLDDTNALLPFIPIINDKNGEEWVVLQGYDTRNEEEADEYKRERFLYYNTFFVDDANKEIFYEWAKTVNFYGRWMPENRGSIDYLWADYPWANAYTESLEEESYRDPRIPCKVDLTYEAQLQEDMSGFADDKTSSSVYAPSADVMTKLGLYTAERGILRKNDNNEIVAINRMIRDESFSGLLIKRKYLNMYLKSENKCMFYCLLGEKSIVKSGSYMLNNKDLTGAAIYNADHDIDMIQPLRVAPEIEQEQRGKQDDGNDFGIEVEKWLSMSPEDQDSMMKHLNELSKQANAKNDNIDEK